MPLTVRIEAGRKTLTHTSWTEVIFVSRKWMSGQAAALAARNDRRLSLNLAALSPLPEPSSSARRPPSPVDFYLSWMSPVYHSVHSFLLRILWELGWYRQRTRMYDNSATAFLQRSPGYTFRICGSGSVAV